jgi:uncharacterized protein YqeY
MLIDVMNKARMDAMKSKDTPTKDLLGVLIGDCTRATKTPTDEFVVAILKKSVENNKLILGDTITVAGVVIKNTATQDQKDAALAEIQILVKFIPAQMTGEAIQTAIGYAKNLGATDMKGIMTYLKENHTGLYDGKVASALVKGAL